MNQLGLGVTVALRDAFSAKARTVGRGFSNLDDIAYRSARGISRSADLIEADVFRIAQTFAAGFAVLGAVGFPIKKAAEFNHAMGEVASIADYATTNLEALRKEVLRQSYVYPTSMMQQIETVYQTISSGFTETSVALRVAEAATRLGVTTLTSTPQALRALTGVLNAYSKQYKEAGSSVVEQLDIVEAKLFETVRWGRIRMDELGKYVGYGASASAIAGINMDDMLASVSAMTLGSLSPEQAFQYYRQLVIGTVKPTRQAEGIAEKYGINMGKDAITNEFGGDWSLWLKNAYEVIAVQNNNLKDFARLLSGRQAFAGAATLINMWEKFTEAREGISNPYTVDEFGQVITSQERAMRLLEKKLSYQWQQFTGAVESIMAVLGNVGEQFLAPIVGQINDFLGVLMTFVDNHPIIQKAFFGIGTTLALSILTFAALQVKILRGSKAWLTLQTAAQNTRFSLLGMNLTAGQTIKTFAGMFALFVGGAWLIRKAYQTNYHGFADTVNKYMGVFNALGAATRDGRFYDLDKTIWDSLSPAQQRLYEGLTQWRYRITTFWEGLQAGFGAFFTGFGETLRKAADAVIGWVSRISPETAERMQAWVESFYNIKDSDVERWRQIGRILGQAVGFITLIGTAMLGWTAIAGALRLSFRLAFAPLFGVKKLLWDLPRRLFGRSGRSARLGGASTARTAEALMAGGGGGFGMDDAAMMGLVGADVAGMAGRGRKGRGPGLGMQNRSYRSDRRMERGLRRFLSRSTPRGVRYDRRAMSMRDASGRFTADSNAGRIARTQGALHRAPSQMREASSRMSRRATASILGLQALLMNPRGALSGAKKLGANILKGLRSALNPSNFRGLSNVFKVSFVKRVVRFARLIPSPYTKAFALVGLAILGIASKWDSITQYMRAHMPTWYAMFSGLGNFVKGIWSDLASRFKEAIQQDIEDVARLKEAFVGLNGYLKESWIGKFRANVKQYMRDAADGGDTVAKLWQQFGHAIRDATGIPGDEEDQRRDDALHMGVDGPRLVSGMTGLTSAEVAGLIQGIEAKGSTLNDQMLAAHARNYMQDQYGMTRLTRLERDQLRANNLSGSLPFDPTRMGSMDLTQIPEFMLREMGANASEFLASEANKSLLRDSDAVTGGRRLWALLEAGQAKIARHLELNGASAGVDIEPDTMEDVWNPNDLENPVRDGVIAGMRETARPISPYASDEYKALWDVAVKGNYERLYEGMSQSFKETLAAPSVASAEAEARRAEDRKNQQGRVEALWNEMKEGIGQIGSMGGDVILYDETVGRVIRRANENHQSDHAPRAVRGTPAGTFNN